VPFFARKNGDWIRSTPAFDGESLFVGGMEEVLHRLDGETGRVLWSVDFPKRFSTPVPDFGFASSPLVAGEHLFIQAASSIVKLEKRSGETVWRALATEEGISKNLSHLFELSAAGDPRSGVEESWTYKASGYMSSPVVVDDHVYLHLGNGRLTCIDLRPGESRWTSTPLGDYWSLAFQDDKILALTAAGELHLLRSKSREMEMLGTASVADQSTWGHIAVDGGRVFVRELEGLRVLSLSVGALEVPSR